MMPKDTSKVMSKKKIYYMKFKRLAVVGAISEIYFCEKTGHVGDLSLHVNCVVYNLEGVDLLGRHC